VRCDECKTDPVTPGHYCECCGRKLSVQERKALETAAAAPAPDGAAHAGGAAQAARCESCGGPADDGALCAACQHAFHSLLESTTLAAPASDPIAAVSEVAPIEMHPSLVVTPRSATPDVVPAPHPREVPSPAPPRPAAQVVAPRLAKAEPIKTKIVKPANTKPTLPMPEAPRPAALSERPILSRSSRQGGRRTRSMVLAGAAVVIVAAIGFPLGKYWLGRQQPPPPMVRPEEQPNKAARQTTLSQRRPTRSRALAATDTPPEARNAPSALTKVKTSVPPPPAVPARVELQPNGARQPNSSAHRTVSVTAPGPAPEVPAAEAASPAPEAVAPEPRSPDPLVALSGPFFEVKEVNESPQVTSRVEPKVPDDLQGRPLNEIVIVRVLVSQTGHPSLVSLLRRSKAGLALDNAVVAAVKQWTFSPARKRGEAVSCWYHFGVPVSRAE